MHILKGQNRVIKSEKGYGQYNHKHGIEPADHLIFIQDLLKAHVLGNGADTVAEAPDDEVIAGTVPEAGEQEDGHKINIGSHLSLPAAAQGEINILSEPGAQRQVPSNPELLERTGYEGITEVLMEIEAEHFAQADGHVRISGEIIVKLHQVEAHGHPAHEAADLADVRPDDPVHHISQNVGNQNFLGQTVDKTAKAERSLSQADLAVVDLLVDILVFYDRSGDKLGEERYIEGQLGQASLGLTLSPVDVNHVGHGLEGKERDSDGQGNLRIF